MREGSSRCIFLVSLSEPNHLGQPSGIAFRSQVPNRTRLWKPPEWSMCSTRTLATATVQPAGHWFLLRVSGPAHRSSGENSPIHEQPKSNEGDTRK